MGRKSGGGPEVLHRSKLGLLLPEFLQEHGFTHRSSSSGFRARSIYERALDVEHRNVTLWLKYAEMEMKNRQINHARNIWDRAITILPRANQFWYDWH